MYLHFPFLQDECSSFDVHRNHSTVSDNKDQNVDSGLSALAVLADAALATNAEQFSLPHDLSCEIPPLPFDERLTSTQVVLPPKAVCHLCASLVDRFISFSKNFHPSHEEF